MKQRSCQVLVIGAGPGGYVAAIRAGGRLEEAVNNRYDSWNHGVGKDIENGTANFESLESYMLTKGEISDNKSGRQEYLENLINEYI